MSYTAFEAEFGDIKISKVKTRLYNSHAEENEFFVRIWDCDNLLFRTEIPKGTVKITEVIKVPPKCPHCKHEIQAMGFPYELQELGVYEYRGCTIKSKLSIPDTYDYDDNKVIELCIHYETVEYKKEI